jgi:predicted AlkP superfamily phosphohydrolase/phosphomutase/tetratricopeptide (TPR) repeat protein
VLKNKLLLVGWDAADWQIINPLLKQGKLPALARLLAKGSSGNIATLDPPISPMLWTSIATGKRPYKHGIHGFTEASEKDEKARPVRVTSRTCKAVWNILNEAGYKTNVIGWWPSYPAERLDGVMVSNFFGVIGENEQEFGPMMPNSVHPDELADKMADLRVHPNELSPEILQPFFPDVDRLHSDDDEILRSTMKILAHAASIHSAATYALAETDWDFTAVYYDALDHFSHIGMKFHPPKLNGVSDDDFKKYHYIVEGAYRFHDMMLERLADLAGDNCNVMLVSDHGFINDHKRLLQLPDEPGAPAIEHRPYGVFIALGPQFISGPVYGASLLDVAPTILQFFGLPAARDFDGRTLNVLVDKPNNNLVDTYETDEDNSQASSVSTDIDDVLMQQLQDLGYVDKNIGAKNGKTVLVENEYYLARSLADGGQYDKAIKTIEPIAKAYPDAARYNQFYASLLLRTGNIELMEEYLLKSPPSPFNAYLKGLLLLQQQRPLLALEEFKRINSKANPAVTCQIAKALLQAGQIEEAERAIQKLIKVDAENHQALNIAGDVAMQLEDWEGALANYLKSIGLLFYQATIHQQVGICLERLEYYHDAAQSFELALQFNPQNEAVKNLLIELYSKQVENPNRLAELKKSETQAEAIVVTGFPRSGTSMMMQLLQKGGIPILHDGTRKKRQEQPQGLP